MQLTSGYLLMSILGNFASIVAPYRIAPGSLKPTKTGTATTLKIFALHMVFPMMLLPLIIPPLLEGMFRALDWWPALPWNLVFSLALLVLAVLIYRYTLDRLGNLLQTREKAILAVVTSEVE